MAGGWPALRDERYIRRRDRQAHRQPRLLVGAASEHWGPGVSHSDDLGRTWQAPEHGAIRFPSDTGAALERVWQLRPGPPTQPGVVYAGTQPSAIWRSDDAGETFSLIRGLWDHPHRQN